MENDVSRKMKIKSALLISFLALSVLGSQLAFASQDNPPLSGIRVGLDKARLFKIYPFRTARTYRQEGPDQWISFNLPSSSKRNSPQTVTFYVQGEHLHSWSFDNRPEMIKEYLGEFCSLQQFPIIFGAIERVLNKMPYKDFLMVTNRHRPVIFSEIYDSGTARFASSQEFIITKDDPPCCSEGFTFMKVGLSLGAAKDPKAIEAVIAHELAHKVLEHIRKGYVNCDAERQANRLIKKWGFEEEFKQASLQFGHKEGDSVSCQEAPAK